MPQLSLYIDKTTLQKIEAAAKLEHLSISKYVVKKLNESMFNAWPENYENLYGSIDDDSFTLVKIEDFSNDAERDLMIMRQKHMQRFDQNLKNRERLLGQMIY
ncbi:hypothetical protein [Sediminispirochaeta smaragdinae]|uniref:Uncharacterized protein n=1 Tax=Sediminispirochaeta smaragdinae (strain DSM 11293 / JCM 15392 / SEBR 4228) TaxID=573413 RepID=E1RBR5_SEDSS|nr:hypothetical protein [Sediminispirochaeta smaragdinae]ADK79795.1 hypothetical protein Spirs_0655 [Sediminispirochaeta smaragdinae DSM 11293]